MNHPVNGNTPAIRLFSSPMMLDLIAGFCLRWGIAEFAVFGSVVTDKFNAGSDVDVLVTFKQPDAVPDRQAMRQELEALFRRPVDVVYRRVIEASENYLLRQAILDSAQVIYAA